MAMQWTPEQVNSRVYDIYVLFRDTVNRTSPYFIGSSVKVNIDYEHSSQDLTGHEKAKKKVFKELKFEKSAFEIKDAFDWPHFRLE